MSTEEKWEDIKGWEDRYQVSTHGRVRSKDMSRSIPAGRLAPAAGRLIGYGAAGASGVPGFNLVSDP